MNTTYTRYYNHRSLVGDSYLIFTQEWLFLHSQTTIGACYTRLTTREIKKPDLISGLMQIPYPLYDIHNNNH